MKGVTPMPEKGKCIYEENNSSKTYLALICKNIKSFHHNSFTNENICLMCPDYKTLELKPCPFCGSKAKLVKTQKKEYFVGCTRIGNCYGNPACECNLGYKYKKDAIELWNRRTP